MNLSLFRPLPHNPSVQNAVVPVKENVQLSVSYGLGVGDIDSFQVAIQLVDKNLNDPDGNWACLVSLPDNPHHSNVYEDCDDAKIEALKFKAAAEVSLYSRIEVFASRSGKDAPKWGFRFFTNFGYDRDEKLKYAISVFGKSNVREFIYAKN